MKEDILLSVVVPVYKVEPYIDKCLTSLVMDDDSLMRQLEVIIINDGTPDNSAEMSREYVKRYPLTFRQIDKENGGHGSAWNVGLKEARGKYLRFLDSDDWFTNLERLMHDLDSCEADIVFNPYIKEFTYDNNTEYVGTAFPTNVTAIINPQLWGTSKWKYNNVNFWSITYKTTVLKPLQVLFAEKTMFDDYILTWAPLVYGRTYASFDYPVYHYLIGRPGQSMSTTQRRKCAESYVKCFAQYELVRLHIDTQVVPIPFLNRIDDSIAGYANFIFPFMIYLPLKESLTRMKFLWKKYLSNKQAKSKLLKRYSMMPGFVFYYVEHLRRIINHS